MFEEYSISVVFIGIIGAFVYLFVTNFAKLIRFIVNLEYLLIIYNYQLLLSIIFRYLYHSKYLHSYLIADLYFS